MVVTVPQTCLLLLVTAVGRVQRCLLLINEETTNMTSWKTLSIYLLVCLTYLWFNHLLLYL